MASSPLLFLSPKPSPLLLHHHRRHLNRLPGISSRCRRRFLDSFVARATKNGEPADPPDRILAAACYLYPFLDGVHYGRFVLTQFPALQLVLQPFVPAIHLFRSSPLTPSLLFFTLYFAVVRNPSKFGLFVRFNTMQAIVLDVLLIFPDLLERTFNPNGGIGLELLQSLDSTVFLFLLASFVYGSTACLLGQVPRLPLVAEAAERRVM
ncbi:protein TIC 20-v, chloroplastic-like [Musa acuminata AAA Group]|uniref:protein TIC 20-v, chloroplastic-like n=1 Tax=Musa acuminata AAA Group TaxID=214697 RepID=UPI0031D8A02F